MDVSVVRVPPAVLDETYFVKVCFAPGAPGGAPPAAREKKKKRAAESSAESDSESSHSADAPKGTRTRGGDYDYEDPFIDDDAGCDEGEPSLFDMMHGERRARKPAALAAPKREVGEEAAAAADAVYRALRTDVAVQGVPAMQGVYYVWRGALGDEGAVRPDVAIAERGLARKQRGRARKSVSSPQRKRPAKEGAVPEKEGGVSETGKGAPKTGDEGAVVPGKEGAKRRLVDVLKAIGDDEDGADSQRAPKTQRRRADTAMPFAEHELAAALVSFRSAAATTPIVDPKKFPSALRPALDAVICAALRLSHLQLQQRAAERKSAPSAPSSDAPQMPKTPTKSGVRPTEAESINALKDGEMFTPNEGKETDAPKEGGETKEDAAVHMSGRNSPVGGDFVSQPPGECPALSVTDTPKRAPQPSDATPKASLSVADNVATVPHAVFEEMSRVTPFSANALERVACLKAFSMARDEIRSATLPALYDALRAALFCENALRPWDDASRRMLYDLWRAELDAALLDRVDTLCEVVGLKTSASGPALAALAATTRRARSLNAPLNDALLRRTLHARVASFTVAEGATEPLLKSQSVAFELIAYRRRVESEALFAEHPSN